AASPEQVAILVRPRPAVRFAVDSGFSGKPLPGKNYRMPGTTMVTYRQGEDPPPGEEVDQVLGGAEKTPGGGVHSLVVEGKAPRRHHAHLPRDGWARDPHPVEP